MGTHDSIQEDTGVITMRKLDAYIAVHGGAGLYSHGVEKEVKRVLREACARAQAVALNSGDADASPSISMVEAATIVLEDDPALNAGKQYSFTYLAISSLTESIAGYGSNLTLDGSVECDAAIISGKGQGFGSVGVVPDVKNPIVLARAILEYSSNQDKLGRVPPLTLVSQGASAFARRVCQTTSPLAMSSRPRPEVVPPSTLISPGAQAQYERWKGRLHNPNYEAPPLSFSTITASSPPISLRSPRSPHFSFPDTMCSSASGGFPFPPHSPLAPSTDVPLFPSASETSGASTSDSSTVRDIQDTVGAVAWHPKDGTSASVSSGGLLLKLPGRVGEAAVYGAGCWAQQQMNDFHRGPSVACSVSGTGEHIVRSSLARVVGERVQGCMLPRSSTPKQTLFERSPLEDEDEEEDDKSDDTHKILQTTLEKDFWEQFQKQGEPKPSAGALLLTREVDEEDKPSVRLWCAFTTPTMAIAYASPNHPKPKAMILRHPDVCNSRHMADKPRIFITAILL